MTTANLFRKLQQGFTLVELLIVIGVLGVLATIVVAAVDPADRIASANDAKVMNDINSIADGIESYIALSGGGLPANLAALVPNYLRSLPSAPTGYTAYTFSCTGSPCTSAIVSTGQLKSKKYTTAGTPVFKYEQATGKVCAVAATTTACP